MKQESILQKRWKKFKSLKRGYYSLCIILILYFISFFLPLVINNRALIVSYNNDLYFPIISGYIPGKQFGLMEVEMTVAPVVVNPDIDSNHEFTAPLATSAKPEPSVNGP